MNTFVTMLNIVTSVLVLTEVTSVTIVTSFPFTMATCVIEVGGGAVG
jgi:hypothetical protein